MKEDKSMKKGSDTKAQEVSIEKQIARFKKDNPNVEETLRLFNISNEYYERSVSAYQNTKTFVTTSTLLPTNNV